MSDPLGRVLVKNVRLSYFHGFHPYEGEDGKKQYGAKLMLPKNRADTKEQLAKLKKVSEEVKKAKWGDKVPKLSSDRVFLRDGDESGKEEYEGYYIIAANATTPPQIKDKDRTPLTAEDGRPYSGCWAHAIITIWAQDNKFGKRLNSSLEGIMFYADDEAFSGRVPVSDEDWSEVAERDGFDDESSESEDALI